MAPGPFKIPSRPPIPTELHPEIDNIDERRELEQVSVTGQISRIIVQDVGTSVSLSAK
jgi:hypothetical protein